MNKFTCNTYKGTLFEFILKFAFISVFLVFLIIYYLFSEEPSVIILLVLGLLWLISFIIVVLSLRKYASQSVEITENELKFFDKKDTLKFTISLSDITKIKPEPYFNYYVNKDLNTKLTIHTQQGGVFTVILSEEGSKAIGQQVPNSIYDEKSLKKIPMYMHLLFGFAVVVLLFFVFIAIIAPDSVFQDTEDTIKLFIYIPLLIAFMVYYINLRRKTT